MKKQKKQKPAKPLTDEQRVRLAQMAADSWRMLLSDPEIALAYVNGELDPARGGEPTASEAAGPLPAESLYAAALAIASERREKLVRLRRALLDREVETALSMARELCGLGDEDEKGHRVN